MSKWRAAAAASVTAALLALSAPAQAQHLRVTDPAGDAAQPGLDVTGVSVQNRDHAIVTVIHFVHDRRGRVVLFLRTRDTPYAQIVVSTHRPLGRDRTFLLGEASCPGLSGNWDRTAATVRLRLPARCVLHGAYGAVAASVLIEGIGSHSGADIDYAPDRPERRPGLRYTEWIPRGYSNDELPSLRSFAGIAHVDVRPPVDGHGK